MALDKTTSAQRMFIASILFSFIACTFCTCPPEFIETSGFCAYTIITPLLNTWRQTQQKCSSLGSNILMVKSDLFWKALIKETASQLSNAPAGVWMGLNYTAATKTFYWFDGGEYYPDEEWGMWAEDELELMAKEKDRCVLIEKTGEDGESSQLFEWILVDCESRHMMGIGICFSSATTGSSARIQPSIFVVLLAISAAVATMLLITNVS